MTTNLYYHVPRFGGKDSKKSAFSLVELLVVVAVMVLLTAAALPAFSGGRARQLATGGNQVVDLANQARQNSISKGVMTALVMVSSVDPEWNYRLFTLVEMQTVANGGATWAQTTPWQMLPKGVLVDSQSSTSFINVVPTLSTSIGSLKYAGKSIPQGSYAYQVFLPDGRLLSDSSANPPTLRLIGAIINSATSQVTKTDTSGVNYYEITLNQYTGIPKVDRP